MSAGLELERLVVRGGSVLVLRLNRPERLNAIDQDTMRALEETVGALQADDDARGLIVTGVGERAFSAGADVSELAGIEPARAHAQMARGQRAFAALEALPVPTVAAINGYALGGGLELALACDFRVATRSALIGQPEITLANIPGWGGTQRLPRIVGEGRAKELIFTGRLVPAEDALGMGLVHEICDPGEAVRAAQRLLERFSGHSRVALALAKQAVHAARCGGPGGYAVEREGVALCCSTPEQAEAVARFLTKSRPVGSEEVAPKP